MDLHGTFGTDPKIAAKLNELARSGAVGRTVEVTTRTELDAMTARRLPGKAEPQARGPDRLGHDALLSGGAPPAKMGLLHFLSMINSANSRYEELDSIKDSAQETRFVGGSQILSQKMAQELGEKVRLSTPVRQIRDWNQAVVSVHTDKGIVRRAPRDHGLVTHAV